MRLGSPTLALALLALPALSFLVIGLVRPLRRSGRAAAALSIAVMGSALAVAIAMWRWAPVLEVPQNPSA
jgi:hypothetical protein